VLHATGYLGDELGAERAAGRCTRRRKQARAKFLSGPKGASRCASEGLVGFKPSKCLTIARFSTGSVLQLARRWLRTCLQSPSMHLPRGPPVASHQGIVAARLRLVERSDQEGGARNHACAAVAPLAEALGVGRLGKNSLSHAGSTARSSHARMYRQRPTRRGGAHTDHATRISSSAIGTTT
jgi:hypothetical protein